MKFRVASRYKARKICFNVLLTAASVTVVRFFLSISQTRFPAFYQRNDSVTTNYKIHWYNLPPYIERRIPQTKLSEFEHCKFSNCEMTFDRSDAPLVHAVIFDGRLVPKKLNFSRPAGQIWIFAAHESPLTILKKSPKWWRMNTSYVFNWTMTYNKDNTDIYLPYGEILKHKHEVKRDFRSLALSKNKTLLMIVSHCYTYSKRIQYVKKLKKYIDVEILGKCGKKWKCGAHSVHDDCFQLLNTTYKFYLAFENSLCHQYFTEKFYENFNYDLIMLTRGGSRREASNRFPAGTYIATEDFRSIKNLGQYLKTLSVDDYADLLRRKSQFYSPGYLKVYQRALCDICERMNNLDKYRKTIKDIQKWLFSQKPCLNPGEVNDIQ